MNDYWYPFPEIYLPLNSEIPSFFSISSDSITGKSIRKVDSELTLALEVISQQDLPDYSVTAQKLNDAYLSITKALQVIKDKPDTHKTSIQYDHTVPYDHYDAYFKIFRYSQSDEVVYVRSLLSIFAQQLAILVTAHISVFEIISGLAGMQQAIRHINDQVALNSVTSYLEIEDQFSTTQKEGVVLSIDETALWRWRIGHAFFAVMLHFSEYHLSLVNTPEADLHIKKSSLYLRASTAAMWYSSAFSPSVYLRLIRPSMVSTNAPHGFSGTDNRDFASWKKAKDKFLKYYSSMAAIKSTELYALQQFENVYYVDMEHHAILANEMVSMSSSLKHDKIASDFRKTVSHSAVDTLREMLDLRKDEFNFLKQKQA